MEREFYISELEKRISEPRKFIQVVAGPRQVGKTTIINQFLERNPYEYIFDTADALDGNGQVWLEQIWNTSRLKIKSGKSEILLVIDEIQKIANWSEFVKKFWDEDTRLNLNIKVILSGSSRLLLKEGLSESLQGRFELIQVPHWCYSEMKEAFGFTLDEYVFFGGYPGSAFLVKDEKRWKSYIRDAMIETSISKDILMLTTITKPALLMQLFDLGTAYSSQIMPFNKMLGTLTDAGNTVTLSHYLTLLDQCGLLGGIQKYSGSVQHSRSSSPKFQVYNNALMSALVSKSFSEARETPDLWGRFVESCVGTHLINNAPLCGCRLWYWRDGNDEVDFVISRNGEICGIEVKSGSRSKGKGMESFKKKFPDAKLYVVSANDFPGSACIGLEDFLSMKVDSLF
ncbi:MAG: ATP-binding protein [Treponema sp.]|uniref:ATP-binding protein n=1 Tax=Treponema sp. TaxID=166 RepID=UPI0025FD94C9|nr:ATP-binding protein [Treponema sp.]MBQ9283094.1 ATP-binding protein [Treponema sp.]